MPKTDAELAAAVLHGQIKKLVPNARGGFYLIWSGDGRFRADACKFKTPPEVGSLISFLPDLRDSELSKSRLRRIFEIVFAPSTKDKTF
jgi:hypothetical protein